MGDQHTHLSVISREKRGAGACSRLTGVGTPATVSKMTGNKRSPAHLDGRETPRTHPFHASFGLERLELAVLRPYPLVGV